MRTKIKIDKQLNRIISIITIVYGLIFITIDILHYFYGIEYEFNHRHLLLLSLQYEPIEIKILNVFYHLTLIFAGISLYKKNSIAWYLYNFVFIGLVLKIPTLLFWGQAYVPNWVASVGMPVIISISGLIYFNKASVKKLINHTGIRNAKTIILFICVFNFIGISVLAYNIGWTPRKQLTNILNEAIINNKKSIFKFHIKNILDTLYINWDNIHGISIIILNDKNNPKYIEKLEIGESNLLCFPYKYNEHGNLILEFDPEPFINCYIYKYDILNRLTTKKLCSNSKTVTFLPDYDTITNEDNCVIFYKYKYLDNRIEEIGYRSENDPFLKYELNQNSDGQIVSRIVISGYSDEGNTYYFYDKQNRKVKIEDYNAKKDLWVREFFYYQNNRLIKSEKYYYGNQILSERLLNFLKMKLYSGKYITYYFTENDLKSIE